VSGEELDDAAPAIRGRTHRRKIMKTTISKTTWNTYRTTGYTHDVANDQASAGGVHHHQIRRTKKGWQKRICQSNGSHRAYGPVTTVDDATGEAMFATAQEF
jgi:hypothetical protein